MIRWQPLSKCIQTYINLHVQWILLHNYFKISSRQTSIQLVWSHSLCNYYMLQLMLSQNGKDSDKTAKGSFMSGIFHNTRMAFHQWKHGTITWTDAACRPQIVWFQYQWSWLEKVFGIVCSRHQRVYSERKPKYFANCSKTASEVRWTICFFLLIMFLLSLISHLDL